MTSRSISMAVPAVLLAILTAGFLPVTLPAPFLGYASADDVLSVIPEGALGFGVINGVGQADAKIQALGKQLQLPTPSLLAMLKARIGLQTGLDEKGSVAVVMMPGETDNAMPIQVLLVPVTDFGGFVGQFGPDDVSAKIVTIKIMNSPFTVGRVTTSNADGGYAVITEPKHRDVLQKILDAPNRVSQDVTPMKQWLAESDVAVVVTRRGVELISNQGQEELRKAKAAFANMPFQPGAPEMGMLVGIIDVYEKILKAIGDEVQTYAAAARIADDGAVHLTDSALVTPGGGADEMLGQVKPPQGNLLAGLPAGPFVVAGAGALPEGLGKAMIDFSVGIMKVAPQLHGLDEEQAARLAGVSRQSLHGIRGMGMLWATGKPGDSLLSGMAVVMNVDDADAYLANYRKAIRQMNEIVKDSNTSIFSATKLEEVQVGDVSAVKISMKIPAGPQAQPVPGYDEMMKALFGPDGSMTAFMAAADEKTIVSVYTHKELLLDSIKAVRRPDSGLAGQEGVIKTAALLPPGAQWVGYWSPKGTVDFVGRMMETFAPDEAVKPPEFPATPPIGFAAKAAPGEIRGYMVVPPAVVKAIGQYVQEIQKMVIQEMVAPQAEPADVEVF